MQSTGSQITEADEVKIKELEKKRNLILFFSQISQKKMVVKLSNGKKALNWLTRKDKQRC